MNNARTTRFAAGVGLLSAIIGLSLASCQVGSSAPSPTLTVTMTAQPSATPVPRLNGQDPLDPGRYRVNAGLPTEITVAATSGWSASGDWVLKGPRGNQPPDGMAIRFYGGALNLYTNPLSVSEGVLRPAVGPTVADLVGAIVNDPAWTATAPTDVTIDGHSGQRVQITIPLDAPLTGPEAFYLFVDPTGGQLWGWAPGQIFDLYIIDVDGPSVDGQRLVIDAFRFPGTSAADVAAQRAVVESVQFGANP